jgi:hypothetical protein
MNHYYISMVERSVDCPQCSPLGVKETDQWGFEFQVNYSAGPAEVVAVEGEGEPLCCGPTPLAPDVMAKLKRWLADDDADYFHVWLPNQRRLFIRKVARVVVFEPEFKAQPEAVAA